MLAYADYSRPFVLSTEASHHGLGANYSSFKLELLALKTAVTEKFKDYLTAAKCVVYTGDNPVAHLSTAKLGVVEQRWVANWHPPTLRSNTGLDERMSTLMPSPITPFSAFSSNLQPPLRQAW